MKTKGILTAALLQLSAGDDKPANLNRAKAMAQEALAKGAKFILLPEVFNYRGDLTRPSAMSRAAETIPGPSTEIFMSLARRHKAVFLLGSILEKDDDAHAFNTSVLVNARGEISAKYRKIHLFDASLGCKIVREADLIRPGRRAVLAKVGGFSVGLSVCYDLRFGGLYQQYAARGADVLTVPSCFTRTTGEAHWEVLLRARAIENLSYVLAPAQVGADHRGIRAHGHSMIVSPWGEVMAQGSGEKQEIIYGRIDIKLVKQARMVLPGIIKKS